MTLSRRAPAALLLACTLVAAGTAPVAAQAPTTGVTDADRQQMSRLIDEFLAVYDPGGQPKELDVSTRLFDTGPDFLWIVDAQPQRSWAEREARIRQRRPPAPGEGDKTGVHDTVFERIVPLGPDAAVLTRAYTYRFTTHAGQSGSQEGVITCAFARRGRDWKVVHYHGSHRPRLTDPAR